MREHIRKVIELEGGAILHQNPGESAHTYAGIYRKAHPTWPGWEYIDRGETPPVDLVYQFYYNTFYRHLEGIEDDDIRWVIFDFAVTAGMATAVKIAQAIVGVAADGLLGQKTISALNQTDPNLFVCLYLLARIKHYLDLANSNPERYARFLRGWLNRVYKGVEA